MRDGVVSPDCKIKRQSPEADKKATSFLLKKPKGVDVGLGGGEDTGYPQVRMGQPLSLSPHWESRSGQ